jgi:hypothetical protein
VLAPRALEQLALLLILQDDGDAEVASAARATIEALPVAPLAAFLGRSDVPAEIRGWFAERGVEADGEATVSDDPLVDTGTHEPEADERTRLQKLAMMTVTEKIKVAMRGSREERGVLIRDPNRLVAVAVLSSPKVTENEIEAFARMANVSDEVLRIIGTTRAWIKSYPVTLGLVRNAKTPVAISLHLLPRLTDRDVKMLATDRNVPDPVRVAARRRMATASHS